jgi:hypothetical protein
VVDNPCSTVVAAFEIGHVHAHAPAPSHGLGGYTQWDCQFPIPFVI